MNRVILLLALGLSLGLAACGEDNPCAGKGIGTACTFVGCTGDGDCTNDQVCYQRNASGYGVRCEKDCDKASSYCATAPAR